MRLEELDIGNAAGFAKHRQEAELLARLPITTAVLGAYTWEALPGNEGEVYAEADRGGRLNRLGMPNLGLNSENAELKEMVAILLTAEKQVAVNFAGFTADEYGKAARAVYSAGATIGEVNFGCPNINKDIVSFNQNVMGKCLMAIKDQTPSSFSLDLKLSPYSNPAELLRIAVFINVVSLDMFADRKIRVVCSNTYPNAYAFKPGTTKPLLSGTGYGGYSGPGYKPIVLGQVKQFREHLRPEIEIVAVGDIQSAQDIYEYAAVGATGFQIGNAFFWNEDGHVFQEILTELAE